jgi:hypothetical protein
MIETTPSGPPVVLHRLVRPSITPDQRRDFRRWSEAINKLDDHTKAEEGEVWIAAAMAILDRPNGPPHQRLTRERACSRTRLSAACGC